MKIIQEYYFVYNLLKNAAQELYTPMMQNTDK